jgi:hypothetical protein
VRPGALAAGLDIFCNHAQAQRVSELNDDADDCACVAAGFDVADEAAVDLELASGQWTQVAQARVSCTEVVDRQEHSDPRQPVERALRGLDVFHRD